MEAHGRRLVGASCPNPNLSCGVQAVVNKSPGTIVAGVLAVALPLAFVTSTISEAPTMGGGCIRSIWRIPAFTGLSFAVAMAIVAVGMGVRSGLRQHRLARWQAQLPALDPIHWSHPSRLGPACPLVLDALRLQTILTRTPPLDGEQLHAVGAWMDGLDHADPLALQTLACIGIEPADTARSLRAALDREGSCTQTGLALLRVVHDFLTRVAAPRGAVAYRGYAGRGLSGCSLTR